MKEKIYTIPVSDALNEAGECAFCAMHESLEKRALDFMLGPSVAYMEDHVRLKTDETGFCAKHYQMMYEINNRLGLALTLYTHFAKVTGDMEKLCKSAAPKKGYAELAAYVDKMAPSCYICDKIKNTFDEYVGTFFYLWAREPEIKRLVAEGNGCCAEHFAMLIKRAAKELSKADCAQFCQTLADVQIKNMARVRDELEWFTKKFDYRYAEEPWGNSKDSVKRGIQKMASCTVQEKK